MRTVMMLSLSLVLVGLFVVTMGCASGAQTDPTDGDNGGRGTITGTVVEDETNLPIEGATVTLITNTANRSTTTDARGAFSLTDVLYGTYTVTAVYAPAGTDLSGTVKVTVSAENKNPSVRIVLKGTSGPPPPPFD